MLICNVETILKGAMNLYLQKHMFKLFYHLRIVKCLNESYFYKNMKQWLSLVIAQ